MKSIIFLSALIGLSFASSASQGVITVDHAYSTESGMYLCLKSKSCSTGEGKCYNNPRFDNDFFQRRKAIMKDLYTSFTQEKINCTDANSLSLQETSAFFAMENEDRNNYILTKGQSVKMLIYNSAQEAMEEVLNN